MIPTTNPYKVALQQFLVQILQEKYSLNGPIIDRLAATLVTERDLQEFATLINHLHDKAYQRALDDYRIQLEKYNLVIERRL